MKTITLTSLIIVMFTTLAFSQKLTQTVRGTIIDTDTKLPLIGTNILIVGTDPAIGTTTDINGSFKIEGVPIGRIILRISYLGYETKTIPDIVVNSGKEVVLDLDMQESVIKLDEVVVIHNENKGEALNDMALLSARSISTEETKRFAGTWDDPSMILNNFAGVASSGMYFDIIIRGNSPKYNQWRLEGVDITAPNHQADQNATIGGFSCLNNKLLAASDFYTGAFSPEYGGVLSGVYDLKLRAGNNEKFEAMAGVGLLGTDFTVEGPIKNGYTGSYLINYRFSNIGLIQKLKLIGDIDGVSTTFQDANFKIVLPTEKMGTFSFFGVGGLDNLLVKDVTPNIWITPGNNGMKPDITQDFDKGNYLANFGVSQTFIINNNSYTKTALTYSGMGLKDDVYESTKIDSNRIDRILNYGSRINTSTYKGSISYNSKIDAKNILHIGTEYSLIDENNNQSQLANDSSKSRFDLIDYKGNITTLQNYISWKHNFSDDLTLVTGLHNMNVLLNNKSTLEPRIAINWRLNNTSSLHTGYGKHSTMENIHNYFSRVQQQDGSIIEPNKNLDLLKADHFVLGYDKSITENVKAKVEVYYQYLYNLPAENDYASYYATINEGSDYKYVPLVNQGSGKNYGIEATVERYFSNHYYFLINGSLFNSKYKSLDGVDRNTKFNNNFLFNLLCGKEFVFGEKQNKTLTVNLKIFYSGGQRYIPLLRDANGSLAVDHANNKFWDYSKAYDSKFEDIFQLNLSVSYKFNLLNITHEIFLDLPNITNQRSRLYEYYDASKPDKVGYVTQAACLPNLMYRVYF
ncbi:MAG: TonB-dependent receptor [Ignavibacteriae bacterium HGW-Ignavibacteriae-2]|nr:MAG: TonB-dependent receptor [Ignavibacteriae bacterium HGW-Ignavibacteriae-2]